MTTVNRHYIQTISSIPNKFSVEYFFNNILPLIMCHRPEIMLAYPFISFNVKNTFYWCLSHRYCITLLLLLICFSKTTCIQILFILFLSVYLVFLLVARHIFSRNSDHGFDGLQKYAGVCLQGIENIWTNRHSHQQCRSQLQGGDK